MCSKRFKPPIDTLDLGLGVVMPPVTIEQV